MFVYYSVNPPLVRRCPVMSVFFPVLSFEHVQNFPPDKTDRDARLMLCHYVAYTLHKSIAKVSSVRGGEFCHRITKFCMFCPFSLRNKSVFRSDQAFVPSVHYDTLRSLQGDESVLLLFSMQHSFNLFHIYNGR